MLTIATDDVWVITALSDAVAYSIIAFPDVVAHLTDFHNTLGLQAVHAWVAQSRIPDAEIVQGEWSDVSGIPVLSSRFSGTESGLRTEGVVRSVISGKHGFVLFLLASAPGLGFEDRMMTDLRSIEDSFFQSLPEP